MAEGRRRHVNGASHRASPLDPSPRRTDVVVGEGAGSVFAPQPELPLARLTAPGGEGSTGRAEPGRFGKRPAAPEPGGQLRPLIGGETLSTQGSRWAGLSIKARTRHLVDQYSYMRRVSPNVNRGLTLPLKNAVTRVSRGDYPARRCLRHWPR